MVGSPCCTRDSQESSPVPQFESINSLALSLLYGPTLTFIHNYWKNHSSDCMDLCQQSDVSVSRFVVAFLPRRASLIAQLIKNPPAVQETLVDSWVRKVPWRREWLPTPVFWPGELHGLYSQWGLKDQASFNCMAVIAICSDFGVQENKVCHCFHCFPICLP